MILGKAIRKGVGFGLTSGIITTLGLIVGLNSSVGSRLVVISGILVIAFADAFSDALGMHISEEAELGKEGREIWLATLATFLAKLIFAVSFVVPFLFLNLSAAMIVSLIWGTLLLCAFSYYLAKKEQHSVRAVVGEHLLIAVLVIVASNYLGRLINYYFN